MRLSTAVVLAAALAVPAAPALAGPPKTKPATAGPKTPKVKSTPAAASAHAAKPPKGPKTTTTGTALPKNPKLVAKMQGQLPPGMTVEQAALGFKNQGQFVAAVNVSRNLGIPFADLKTSMVDSQLSLGQSIQRLKPLADADAEAARALRLANEQLEPR
jgi:hypothetical protein